MPVHLRLRALVALPVLLLGLVVTVLGVAPSADASTWRQRHLAEARHIALNQIGDPYAYGAAGPNRFDCSGLIYYSYRRAGFHVPRTSSAQAGHARRIPKSQLRPGDFMYFYDGGGVYHVAIFLRWSHHHALMLHSPRPGERVRRDAPWTHRWFAGTLRGL